MSGSARGRNHPPRGTVALESILIGANARSPERAQKPRAFSLTLTYMDVADSEITTHPHIPGMGTDSRMSRLAPDILKWG